jgi:selenocysteine lyase/cysteine desulfurase
MKQWRKEFGVTERFAYFDHASVGPTPRRAVQAVTQTLSGQSSFGSLNHPALHERAEDARRQYAKLIGARPEQLAYISSTSAGVSLIARGLEWRGGDEVVVPAIDFPSAVLPWMILQREGVVVRRVPCADGRVKLDDLLNACGARTRVVCASWIQFSSGHRLDLARLGEECRRRGILSVIDGAQGVGALSIDVSSLPIDALLTHGYKWLLGPQGVAWLYLSNPLSAVLRMSAAGLRSMMQRESYSDHSFSPRADASRFETGILNFHGIAGAQASVELLEEVGVQVIERRVGMLIDLLCAGLLDLGCQLKGGPDRTDFRSGIVAFRHPRYASDECQANLAGAGIVTSVREDWVRVSPHFYNSEDEIDRLLRCLKM